MTLVLLVLAGIWAAVLIPPALRARAESRPADSITAFRRQLSVLRRTGPRSERRAGFAPSAASGARSWEPRRTVATPQVHPALAARRMAAGRSRTLRRRRDVLLALVSTVGATLVIGFYPPLRWAWIAHAVADLLLLAYVGLLVHQRNVTAERDLKVRFLPHTRPSQPLGSRTRSLEPALLRRSGT